MLRRRLQGMTSDLRNRLLMLLVLPVLLDHRSKVREEEEKREGQFA